VRKVERGARESSGEIVLLDEESGEQFVVSRDAFLRVLASFGDDGGDLDPEVAPLLDRLDRLVVRDSGERFWLAPTRLMNAEEGYEE